MIHILWASLVLFACSNTVKDREPTIEDVLRQHFEAMGGLEQLEATQTLYTKTISQSLEFVVYVKEGQQYRLDSEAKTIIYNQGKGVQCENDLARPLENTSLWSAIENSFIFKLYHGENRGWTFELQDDPATPTIEIVGENKILNMYNTYHLAPSTKLITKIENDMNQVIRYSEYVEFDGIKYPTKYEVWNGEVFIPCHIVEVNMNPELDDRLFDSAFCTPPANDNPQQNPTPMIRFSDLNNNRYRITTDYIEYDPIKAHESSSGVYDGGKAWKVNITKDQYQEVYQAVRAIIDNPKLLSETRSRMTGFLRLTEGEKASNFILKNGEAMKAFQAKLNAFKPAE